MTGESREMTLDEWVDRLPPHHGARRERDRLREVEAEIERLRADLVWSVREDCRLVGRYVWQVASGYIECDGTPESICRAVREARDGR